jgi:hypothetical protein
MWTLPRQRPAQQEQGGNFHGIADRRLVPEFSPI